MSPCSKNIPSALRLGSARLPWLLPLIRLWNSKFNSISTFFTPPTCFGLKGMWIEIIIICEILTKRVMLKSKKSVKVNWGENESFFPFSQYEGRWMPNQNTYKKKREVERRKEPPRNFVGPLPESTFSWCLNTRTPCLERRCKDWVDSMTLKRRVNFSQNKTNQI